MVKQHEYRYPNDRIGTGLSNFVCNHGTIFTKTVLRKFKDKGEGVASKELKTLYTRNIHPDGSEIVTKEQCMAVVM